jgi:predicted short-subunit dehydrogenase-like oxidoreductase (DUF2520 family)
MTQPPVVIVGAGRVGLSLARALTHVEEPVRLLGRVARPAAAGVPAVESDWRQALTTAGLVVIAAPDDAIAAVVQRLVELAAIHEGTVVLHTSGMHDASILAPLEVQGASTGSWHPLQSIPDGAEAGRFRGIPAIVEGDEVAVLVARALAVRLEMAPILELPAAGKVRYHAAAVFAANYLVVLNGIAERLAEEAGAGAASRGLFHPIMRQVLANLEERTPTEALTGPVRRGDVGTVLAHLGVLGGLDREAYLVLAREALELADAAGLGPEQVTAMRNVLR